MISIFVISSSYHTQNNAQNRPQIQRQHSKLRGVQVKQASPQFHESSSSDSSCSNAPIEPNRTQSNSSRNKFTRQMSTSLKSNQSLKTKISMTTSRDANRRGSGTGSVRENVGKSRVVESRPSNSEIQSHDSKPTDEWWLNSKTVHQKNIRVWIADEVNDRDDLISKLKLELARKTEKLNATENELKIKNLESEVKISSLEKELKQVVNESEQDVDNMRKEMKKMKIGHEGRIDDMQADLTKFQNTVCIIQDTLRERHEEDEDDDDDEI